MSKRRKVKQLLIGGGGSVIADPYVDYLVYDDFAGSDGDDLTTRTAEKDIEGNGWASFRVGGTGGTWEIETGDKCRKVSADGNLTEHGSVIDSGKSDITVEATIEYAGTAGQDVGLIFRWQDKDNWICLDTNASKLRLLKYTGGSGSVVTQVNLVLNAGTFVFKVVAIADSVMCYIDDVEKISITNSDFQTETHQGIRQYETAADPPYENYFQLFTVVDES